VSSVWIRSRTAKDGSSRSLVEYRPGGAEERVRHAGSFRTKRLARIRVGFVEGELAAGRIPDLALTAQAATAPTFEQAAATWRASRVDVAETTSEQHRIQTDKLLPLIGTRRIDTLDAAAFVDVVAKLHGAGVARETIRKTLGAGAMVLDHAGVQPNPARDRAVKLPREEPEEINPPSAADVETVYRTIPAKHRLALLWLDWSGARVSSVDRTLVGDYDEPAVASACGRPSRRLGSRSGSSFPRRSPRRSRRLCRRERIATPRRGCSPRAAPTRCERRSRRRVGRSASRSGRRTTCAIGESRCCTCGAYRGRESASS
jgi:hypothetical protein